MLAYSTIAHVGFIFAGVVTGTAAGYAASMFYVLAYAPGFAAAVKPTTAEIFPSGISTC